MAAALPSSQVRSPKQSAGRRRPHLERLEERCLLDNTFIQGVAYLDDNVNDQLDVTDPRQAGARIELFREGDPTPLRTTFSDADGYYVFLDVAPGRYRVVETPPEGFVNRSAQGNSQLHPVTVPPGTRNTIQIDLLDPAQFSSIFLQMEAHRLLPQNAVILFGVVPPGFTGPDNPVGQFHLLVDRPGLPTLDFLTYCAELVIANQFPFGQFTPVPLPVEEPVTGRQLGYLFNRYGTRTDLTNDQAAGLQMAIWELLWDPPSADAFNTGNFRYVITDPEVLRWGNFYLADSAGKSEYASFHRSNGPQFQSFLGTLSLNFGAIPAARAGGAVTQQQPDCFGPRQLGGQAGVRILLERQVNGQFQQAAERTTGPGGSYTFTTVEPGTYRVRQVIQGFTQLSGPAGTFVVTSGGNVTGLNFHNELPLTEELRCGSISGRVTFQVPTCTVPEDRGGLGGVTVYIDVNRNNQPDANEPRAVTTPTGTYQITPVGRGDHRVRPVVQPGFAVLGRPFVDVIQDTTTFTVTGVDFRLEVVPTVPLICDVRRDVLPVFPGNIPAVLAAGLGGKGQLLASSFLEVQQNGDLLSQSAFVTGVYRHVLNRAPEPAGVTFWVQQLQNGLTRGQFVAAVWNSVEHRMLQVDYYYQTFLGRAADPAGRAVWVSALQNGLEEKVLLSRFLGSAEYAARSGPTNETYVARLYVQLLGRPAEVTGHAAWVQALQGGVSREAVALAFLNSRESSRQLLDLFYTSFLDRRVDPSGEQAFLTALGSGRASWALVAQVILASDEYFTRLSNLARGSLR